MLIIAVGVVASIINILLGLFILFNNPKSVLNKGCFAFVTSFGIWGMALVFYVDPIFLTSNFWIRATYALSIVAMGTIVYFFSSFPKRDKFFKFEKILLIFHVVSAPVYYYLLFFTDTFVEGVTKNGNIITSHLGPLYLAFVVFDILPIISYAIWRLIYRWHVSKGVERTQLAYLTVGILTYGLFAMTIDVIIPLLTNNTNYFGLSPITLLPMSLMIAYSIIQHRLMHVRLAILLIIEKTMVIGTLVVPVILLVYLLFDHERIVPFSAIYILLIVLLVFSREVLTISIGTFGQKLLYKKEHTNEKIILSLIATLNKSLDSGVIKSSVEESFKKVFNARFVELVLQDGETFDEYFEAVTKKGGLLIYEELKRQKVLEPELLRQLEADLIEVVVPIESSDKLIAIVLLGEKRNRSIYGKDEILELDKLRYQIGVSLENASLITKLEDDKVLISAERNKLAITLAGVNDTVIALDRDRKIVVTNPSANKLLNIEKDLVGESIDNYVTFVASDETQIKSERYCPVEINSTQDEVVYFAEKIELQRSDGVTKNVRVQVSTIKEAAQSDVSYIMVLHDISEEEQLERMKLDFVAMAAHELRTPLTSMKGYLSLYRDKYEDKSDADESMLLGRIESSTQQLMGLMENLLSVSQIEQGDFNVRTEAVDWVLLVSEQIGELDWFAKDRGITLVWEPTRFANIPHVLVDKNRINEVINNLVSNAVKYTREGSVTITVEYNESERVVITHVADTGQGIPPEALPHMFKKFFRVWGQLEMGSKGTGLGLYIAKSIVDMHHGKIWVESEGVGKGSTFSFSLPLAD